MNKDSSPRVVQREKLKEIFGIKEFRWTERQKLIIEQLLDKKNQIILLSGPAGSSKTLLSIYVALKYLLEKKVDEILYVRTVIESASKSMGFLPGTEEEKFALFSIPLREKLQELVTKSDEIKLFRDDRIKCLPVNFMRGISLNAKFIVGDELQNFTFKEIVTLMTRIGKFSKLILAGDTMQSDINSHSGFKQVIEAFNDEESRNRGIISIQLGTEDIMRSEIVKFVVERLEKIIDKKKESF
jgi:phosphate starvation-inducible PhoH-like protein